MNTLNLHVFLFGIFYCLFMVPEAVSLPIARTTVDFNGPTEDLFEIEPNAKRNSGSVLTTISGKQETEVTLNIPELVSVPEARPTDDFNWSRMSYFGRTEDGSQLELELNKKDLFLKADKRTLSAKKKQTTMSSKQKTVTKVSEDQFGPLEYNPWVITFGNQLMDAGHTKDRKENKRVSVASNPVKNYDPINIKLSTVCTGTTIPYGEHKVMKWLDRHVHKHEHSNRAFYMELRHDLFIKANSEMCHDKKYVKWMDYQECSLRRHQRLESYIPQYPLHQILRD
ncbi:uncharacterized protein [Drosophila virilis]|uniref:Uncharacterized protein n=1 Tax=Drosophila virilis TaxID=7244 RepID=B4LD20_DROVI|nr:uncharacterized protein LOC6622149 [Drosophila virilis]EDW69901.2 uncharacterized protein Dvir_GJ11864 [Drosophila virilis]